MKVYIFNKKRNIIAVTGKLRNKLRTVQNVILRSNHRQMKRSLPQQDRPATYVITRSSDRNT